MEIINKQLSPEASVKVEISNGKIQLSAVADTPAVDANLSVSVDSDYLLDQLAAKIPGQVDDAVFAVLKSALKML